MRVIIAPTDFSPTSINAVKYAADMACVTQSRLALLHVCALPIGPLEVGLPGSAVTEMITEEEGALEKLKDDLEFRTGGRVDISTTILFGSLPMHLQSLCDTLKPYVVVMASQGHAAFERILFGSNTLFSMRNLGWPLLVVPPGAKFTDIRKIGLACDLRKVIETTPVEAVIDLVKEFKATLDVIHVNAGKDAKFRDDIIEESAYLQEILASLNPRYHILNDADIGEGVMEFAVNNKLDLLIVIPKVHNLADAILHKSQAKELLLNSDIPILSINEQSLTKKQIPQ